MKKTLIALAAVAATGAAFAQSAVTLSGTFDLSTQSAKNDVATATTIAKNGMASSRIQFAGTEDLGGGMKANFTCDTTLSPNAGVGYASATASATATTSFCDRIGLVGVQGDFGRVDLGGDYTPMFRITGIADPFGTNGVGSWYNLGGVIARGASLTSSSIGSGTYVLGTGTGASLASPWYTPSADSAASGARANEAVASVNAARANNTITYSTPVFNGVQAVAMYMVDGNSSINTTGKLGAGSSLRVRYDAGPLTLAVGTQTIKHGITTTTTANVGTNILAGSYDFGVAKATFGYQTQKLDSLKAKDTILGLIVPMGANTIRATYSTKSVETADSTGEFGATQLALGIAHALSKRTDVYAQYARVSNDANAQYGVLTPTAGLAATAWQVGFRHAY
jgi:predicted porin